MRLLQAAGLGLLVNVCVLFSQGATSVDETGSTPGAIACFASFCILDRRHRRRNPAASAISLQLKCSAWPNAYILEIDENVLRADLPSSILHSSTSSVSAPCKIAGSASSWSQCCSPSL